MSKISDIHFKIALTSDHVAGFVEFRSASSEGSGRKKKIEDRGSRIEVKPKSADHY